MTTTFKGENTYIQKYSILQKVMGDRFAILSIFFLAAITLMIAGLLSNNHLKTTNQTRIRDLTLNII